MMRPLKIRESLLMDLAQDALQQLTLTEIEASALLALMERYSSYSDRQLLRLHAERFGGKIDV